MPGDRSIAVLSGRVGAHRLHAMHDSKELTKNARAAFHRRFYDQTDPALPEAERIRRAEHLRRAHMAELSLKSARARRRRNPMEDGDA